MTAHRAIESVTLDKETMHKKDEDHAKVCRTYLQWLLVFKSKI